MSKSTDDAIRTAILNENRARIALMLHEGRTPQEIHDFCHYPLRMIYSVQQSMLKLANEA